MKIVIDINHPADVHFFKNFIRKTEKKGHEILITATEKDVSIKLLDSYGFEYENLGSYGVSLINKIVNIPIIDLKMYKAINDFRPDIFIGFGSIRAAHVSRLMRKPYIDFNDTEHATEQHILYSPFADVICTPFCYNKNLGKKQIRFNGYKELAYLHPNYFTPNPSVLDSIGFNKDDIFIILRLVNWDASHDIGQHGIKNKITLIKELENYGQVLITSEGQLDNELNKYKIKISPETMHDLMYYASLYIGEGGTMATESALLGTPSIYISSLVGKMGNFIELEQKYGLIFSYKDNYKALNKAIELLRNPELRRMWKEKRRILLKDKIDVTSFMVWFVENYPRSFDEMKKNPKIQNTFIYF